MRATQIRRVLLVLPSEDIGGTELHTVGLAQAMREHGLEVVLACDPSLADRLRPSLAGITLREAPVSWSASATPAGARGEQAAAVAPLLEELRPDAVVLALPWPNFGLGVMQAASQAGLPLMVISHLAPTSGWLKGMDGMPWPLRTGLVWAAVSDPVARQTERLFDLPPGSVRTVPNGVMVPAAPAPEEEARLRAALRAELGVPADTPVALFAGRLEKAKGADLLPEIAHAFQAACGGVVACAGRGPLRIPLSAAKGDALHLLGYRQDVDRLLLGADALLLPSRMEGLPLIYLEASARRRPVVASWSALACFGDRAAARAVMVADEDAAGFAQALAEVVQPGQAQAVVEEAWHLAAAHDRAAMHKAHIGLLRSLCALGA